MRAGRACHCINSTHHVASARAHHSVHRVNFSAARIAFGIIIDKDSIPIIDEENVAAASGEAMTAGDFDAHEPTD